VRRAGGADPKKGFRCADRLLYGASISCQPYCESKTFCISGEGFGICGFYGGSADDFGRSEKEGKRSGCCDSCFTRWGHSCDTIVRYYFYYEGEDREQNFQAEIEAGCTCRGDMALLQKAVSNIISNAVTHSPAQTEISVKLTENTLQVRNSGISIDSADLEKIFEPFYRPDFARDRDKGGNGLGLYIVDTLLKTMNIFYSFCPMEEPQGMRFTIHL